MKRSSHYQSVIFSYRLARSVAHNVLRNLLKPLKIAFNFARYTPNHKDTEKLLELLKKDSLPALETQAYSLRLSQLIETTMISRMSSKDLSEILAGLITYRQHRVTPKLSHFAFIRAYEKTNGVAQQVLHSALFDKTDALQLIENEVQESTIGRLTKYQVFDCIGTVHDNGYAVLPLRVPSHIISSIIASIDNIEFVDILRQHHPCRIKPEVFQGFGAYGPKNPAEFPSDLIKLKSDPLLLLLASMYLETNVEALSGELRYTFPAPNSSATLMSESAQLFHYDLDTLRWLKIFIYLNDVTNDSGPHEYVKGTHLPGNKPVGLLMRNYSRVADREIETSFGSRVERITGPAGTIILADTRCFHKGTVPAEGYRLMFTSIYAPSRISVDQL